LILASNPANRRCWSQKARRPLEQAFEFRRVRAFGKRGERCRDQIRISGIKRQRVTFTGDRAELGRTFNHSGESCSDWSTIRANGCAWRLKDSIRRTIRKSCFDLFILGPPRIYKRMAKVVHAVDLEIEGHLDPSLAKAIGVDRRPGPGDVCERRPTGQRLGRIRSAIQQVFFERKVGQKQLWAILSSGKRM
jgi:hypothetical protein